MADSNPIPDDEDLEPIGEAQARLADEDLEPLDEVQVGEAAPPPPPGEAGAAPEEMSESANIPLAPTGTDAGDQVEMLVAGDQVSQIQASETVEKALRLSEELRESGVLGHYFATRAELAHGALTAGYYDDADISGREIIALAEAYRKLKELEDDRKRRSEGRANAVREQLLDEIQQIVSRSIGQAFGGERLTGRIRAVATEVAEVTVGRASARLGKELGTIQSSVAQIVRQEAESAIKGAEDRFSAIARREAREYSRETWKETLASKDLADKIKELATAKAEDIVGTETAKLAAELRGEMSKKIDQAIEMNLGGRDLREVIAEIADARFKELFGDRQAELFSDIDRRIKGPIGELRSTIEQVDQTAEDVAGFAREEVAKLRSEIAGIKEGGLGDADSLHRGVERTTNLLKQEVQRFTRELETLRTRSSENTADLKAEIEKVRVFTREEIGRLSSAIEEARQSASESTASGLDESSVRKIVQEVVQEDDKAAEAPKKKPGGKSKQRRKNE